MKKVYLCFLTLTFILAFQIKSSAEMRSSITQYGITWNFDGQYECGQFVTGDWWVVGPVTIVNTNPAQTSGRNGSMLNPIGSAQGYDDRGVNYNASVRVSFPITLAGVNSLVTTLSETRPKDCETGAGNAAWTSRFGRCDNRSAIRTMAVLTIVHSMVPAGTFRPSYIGSGYKEFFNISQLDYNVLPHLPAPASTPNASGLIALLERPWLDHYNGWTTQINYAFDNSSGYGKTLCDDISNIACCLMLDIPEVEQLAMLMVQRGIELYGGLRNGASWPADGGHGSGRKLPVLLAGKLLNNSNMLSIGSTYPTSTFGEDCQTYYVGGQPWWGIKHCTNPELDGDALTSYRVCCTAVVWSGESLSAQMLGLRDEWNHNAFFDYVDRWISDGGGYGASYPSFIQEMWSTYRNNLPAEIPHNGGGGISDEEAPTVPTGLNASNITGGSLSLSWSSSTDNVNVIAYDIYQDDSFVKTISGAYISTLIDNLICNTTYSFKVLARDASGNSSDFSNIINVTTTNECAPINVALNKTVIASAIDGVNTGNNLVDGITSDNARWSASGIPQWAEIDLGSDQDIISFDLFTYQSRAYQYTIEAKADGGTYSVVVDRSSNTSNSQPISDDVDITARFIKLTVTGASGYTGTWVSINELEVLIDGNSTPPVDVPVEGISVSPVTLDLTAGQSAQLTETVLPSNATNKNVTWTSLDETIATVDNSGLVTAIDVGTTTITVISNDDNSISANCAVTVSTVPPPTGGFYCDPVNGNMSNTGAENSPWSTLAEVISAGKTFQVGDIIYLKNGDHGWPDITQNNSGVVTIKNYPGHEPVINRLDFNNASHWKVEGVKIYTSSAPPAPPVLEHPVYGIYDNYLVRLNGSSNITIDSCQIYSIENSSTWTADDWNYKAWCGVYFYNYSNNNTIKNSTIKNINFAIDMSYSSSNNVQNNTIQNFCGDGVRVSTDCIIENNQILDSYSTNGNHADAMQAFASARAIVRNNTIISATSERSFIAYGMQGLGFFDGFFTDYIIENNLIVCHTWHGISLYGATNCKIVNNTVVENPNGTNPYGPPWIAVYNHKDGSASSGNIVSNNLTSDIGSMQGATATYNIETTDYTSHFVDYAALDFHLLATSSAIDAGTSTNAPSTDIEGASRPQGYGIDIGAYEGAGVVIPDDNIALNKPVAVSAYQDDEFGYQPGTMLVDGNVSDDARWAASGFPQWAEIDLGQNYDLTEIKLYPYQNRAYQYVIEGSTDGSTYTAIVDRSTNTESADELVDNVSGTYRYIKITVSGLSGSTSTWVSLAELKVYGGSVTQPNNPPTIDPVSDINVLDNAGQQTVSLTGISDGDGGTQTISIVPSSSNDNVVNNVSVDYTSGNTTGTLTFDPISAGTSTITITVTDDGGTENSGVDAKVISFDVTVEAVCSGVTGVSITCPPSDLNIGDTFQSTATVVEACATDKSVTWSSSDENVITVVNGLFTAVSAGSATITATTNDAGFTADCTVTVIGGSDPIEQNIVGHWSMDELNGSITPDNSGNGNDGTVTEATITSGQINDALNFDGSNDKVSLGNLDVVSNDGITLAAWINPDTWVATYRDDRIISKATGTGEQDHYWMMSAIASGSNTCLRFRLKTGTTTTLIGSTNIPLNQWTHVAAIYDGANMKVYINGTLDGLDSKTGTVATSSTIEATIGINPDGARSFDGQIDEVYVLDRALSQLEISDLMTREVNSTILVSGVSVSPTSLTLDAGQTFDLTETIAPVDATNQTVTWSSSNPLVATVDLDGLVTAIDEGTAVITVTTEDGNFSATCNVLIIIPVTGVSIDPVALNLGVGQTFGLTEIISPEDATIQSVSWLSDDPTVCIVDQNGLVNAVSEGTATIFVTTNDGGFTATCTVNVTIPVDGVYLSASTLDLEPGQTSDLDETVSPVNATDPTVVWTSDDETIAVVDQNGNVTAIAEGTTDITVTTNDGDYTATCVVTVTAIPNRVETLSASADDIEIRSNGGSAWVGSSLARVGGAGSGYDGCLVIPFQLPALNTGEAVLSANFSATLKRVANSPAGNVDVYGLPYRTSNTVLSSDYYQGAFNGDANATSIQDDFATPDIEDELLLTSSSGASINLTDYLNAQFAAGAQTGDYIFIRLNPDVADVSNYYFWEFYTANSANAPVLEIEIGNDPSKNGQTKTGFAISDNNCPSIHIWPNPVSEGHILSVGMNNFRNNDCLSLRIYDITGKTVYVKNAISVRGNISITLNTSGILKKGIYIISVTNGITEQKEKLIIR